MAQPLNNKVPIINPDGTPTDYFIRLLQDRGIVVDTKVSETEAEAIVNTALADRDVFAGTGLDGGGPLSADVTIDLADTAVTPGTYGDTTNVPQITVDQQGRITDILDIAITGGGGGAGTVDAGILHVRDEKAASTDGGTFTSGAWKTRTLNTTVSNTISGASLASNQVTLPAGTYDILAVAPAHQVEVHQARLQNITDGTTTLLGSTERSRATSTSDGTSSSTIKGRFTITSPKTFQLQHRCTTTGTTAGFGAGSTASWGNVVFAEMVFRKIVSGQWSLVDSDVAAASSSLTLSVNSAGYDEWMLIGRDVILSGANELNLRVGTGVGPTIDTGNNYDFGIEWRYGTAGAGTASRAFVSATSSLRLGTVSSASSASGVRLDFDCTLKNLVSGANMKLNGGTCDYDGGGGLTITQFSGVHLNAAYDVSALQVLPSAGTITSGTFYLYGRRWA